MLKITRRALCIGSFSLYWYGVLIALGALIGVFLMSRREKRYHLPKDTALNLVLFVLPFGLIGTRMYYVIFHWDLFKNNLWEILNVRGGGMAVPGGILTGIFMIFLFAKIKRLPFLSLTDLFSVGIAFAQGIGRWGNFLNREAYGFPISRPELCFFPLAVYIEEQQAWFAATFFYESIACFLICLLILLAEKKGFAAKAGTASLLYGILYTAERVVVEGMRSDSLYQGPIRVTQLLCALILTGITLYRVFRFRGRGRVLTQMLSVVAVLGFAVYFVCTAGASGTVMLWAFLPAALMAGLNAVVFLKERNARTA